MNRGLRIGSGARLGGLGAFGVRGGGASDTTPPTVTIDNTGNGNTLTNYPVRVNVTFLAGMQADFSDLRFMDDDDATPLKFWIESYVASTSAVVWVKVPSIAASSTATIYMHYGDTTAAAKQDALNTFTFFTDFDYDGPVSSAGIRYSMVVLLSGTYYMFVNNQTTFAIDLYTSSSLDGPWSAYGSNPVLALGAGGAWDSVRLAWGSIGLESGVYYMFYGGSLDGNAFKGGLATSTDLISWTKDPGNPIINSSLADVTLLTDLDRNIVKYDGKYWLGYDTGDTKVTLSHATALAGPWTNQGAASIQAGAGGTWDDGGVKPDCFVKEDSTYYMFYRGSDGVNWGIGYATASAPDGTFTKSASNPLLLPDQDWDESQVVACTVVKAGQKYHMFFTGGSGASSQVGHTKALAIGGPYATRTLTYVSTPVVNASIVTLQTGDYVHSGATTYQYKAIRFRANFQGTNGDATNLKWVGLINGTAADRALVSTQRSATKLYLNTLATVSTYIELEASVANAHKVYEIRWKSGETKTYVNDVLVITDTTQVPSAAIPLVARNYEDATNDLLVDWIAIREYSYPEPTTSIA